MSAVDKLCTDMAIMLNRGSIEFRQAANSGGQIERNLLIQKASKTLAPFSTMLEAIMAELIKEATQR